MIFGNAENWEDRFKRYDERLIKRICEILPECIAALPDNPHEDRITCDLVCKLKSDIIARELFHYYEYQFEPPYFDEKGVAYSKGRIDFAAFWDHDPEKYLGYEAKRLNIKTAAGRARGLATEYVTKGLVRFVEGQYSAGLPVGCMLGYVLGGNINIKTIRSKIVQAIIKNKRLVALIAGPYVLPTIASANRMASDHRRKGTHGKINIRQALIPCSR